MATAEVEHNGSEAIARWRAVALTALTVEVAVLVVTGIALYFVYRPDLASHRQFADLVRATHRIASWLAVWTALVVGGLFVLPGRRGQRRSVGVALGVGIGAVTLAALLTGIVLPYDQIALSAITVGSNTDGYHWVFSDGVRFFLIDNTEVSRASLLRGLVLHALVIGGTLVLLVGLAWRRVAVGRAAPPIPAADGVTPDPVESTV